MRREASTPGVDLVLVGVDQVEVRIAQDRFRDLEQGAFGEDVLGAHEGHVGPRRKFEGAVGRLREVRLRCPAHDLEARLVSSRASEEVRHGGIGRGVVDDAQFPMPIELCPDRAESLLQHLRAGVADRHHDRDQRWVGDRRDLDANACPVLLRQAIDVAQPGVVAGVPRRDQGLRQAMARPHPLAERAPEYRLRRETGPSEGAAREEDEAALCPYRHLGQAQFGLAGSGCQPNAEQGIGESTGP